MSSPNQISCSGSELNETQIVNKDANEEKKSKHSLKKNKKKKKYPNYYEKNPARRGWLFKATLEGKEKEEGEENGGKMEEVERKMVEENPAVILEKKTTKQKPFKYFCRWLFHDQNTKEYRVGFISQKSLQWLEKQPFINKETLRSTNDGIKKLDQISKAFHNYKQLYPPENCINKEEIREESVKSVEQQEHQHQQQNPKLQQQEQKCIIQQNNIQEQKDELFSHPEEEEEKQAVARESEEKNRMQIETDFLMLLKKQSFDNNEAKEVDILLQFQTDILNGEDMDEIFLKVTAKQQEDRQLIYVFTKFYPLLESLARKNGRILEKRQRVGEVALQKNQIIFGERQRVSEATLQKNETILGKRRAATRPRDLVSKILHTELAILSIEHNFYHDDQEDSDTKEEEGKEDGEEDEEGEDERKEIQRIFERNQRRRGKKMNKYQKTKWNNDILKHCGHAFWSDAKQFVTWQKQKIWKREFQAMCKSPIIAPKKKKHFELSLPLDAIQSTRF